MISDLFLSFFTLLAGFVSVFTGSIDLILGLLEEGFIGFFWFFKVFSILKFFLSGFFGFGFSVCANLRSMIFFQLSSFIVCELELLCDSLLLLLPVENNGCWGCHLGIINLGLFASILQEDLLVLFITIFLKGLAFGGYNKKPLVLYLSNW